MLGIWEALNSLLPARCSLLLSGSRLTPYGSRLTILSSLRRVFADLRPLTSDRVLWLRLTPDDLPLTVFSHLDGVF